MSDPISPDKPIQFRLSIKELIGAITLVLSLGGVYFQARADNLDTSHKIDTIIEAKLPERMIKAEQTVTDINISLQEVNRNLREIHDDLRAKQDKRVR